MATVDEIYQALSAMPWYSKIEGFTNDEDITHLTWYLTNQWLSDVHQNEMLDLLQHDLALDAAIACIEVENMAFMVFIKWGYKAQATDSYENSNYFAHAHGLSTALASGERESVLLMKNITGAHWVGIVCDFANSCIMYGDSFNDKAPADMVLTIKWWTHHHTGITFSKRCPDITQQTDSFSCRMYSHNGLSHFTHPERYPLIHPSTIANTNLRTLLAIIQCHETFIVSTSVNLHVYHSLTQCSSHPLNVLAGTSSSHSWSLPASSWPDCHLKVRTVLKCLIMLFQHLQSMNIVHHLQHHTTCHHHHTFLKMITHPPLHPHPHHPYQNLPGCPHLCHSIHCLHHQHHCYPTKRGLFQIVQQIHHLQSQRRRKSKNTSNNQGIEELA